MVARSIHQQLARDLLSELQQEQHDAGTPSLALALLRDAIRERATDAHLEPCDSDGGVVRFRVDGTLLDAAILPREIMESLENQFKVMARLDPLPATKPKSARWTTMIDDREVDVRLTALTALGGERLTLRLLDPRWLDDPDQSLALDAHHLDRLLDRLTQREGMLLVTGPTGSGKTTTVYNLMRRLADQPHSIISIEDPPEFHVPGATQIAVEPEHGVSFPQGIRAALRMDPDYLLVGELRDEESTRAALDAATTGCVVFGTLHARDAVGVVTSLRKWNADNYELSTLLSAIVAQRLVRRLCSNCRRQTEPSEEERKWFEQFDVEPPKSLATAVGCPMCHELGHRGRMAVFETWMLDETDRSQLLAGADERELRMSLTKRGHQFLIADVLAKVSAGNTDMAELRAMGGFGPSLEAISAVQNESDS